MLDLTGITRRRGRFPRRREYLIDHFSEIGVALIAGLLGEIGQAINSQRLQHIARLASWALPFDALYEDALHRLTVDTTGFAEYVLKLGPFGGSHQAGTSLLAWSVLYLVLVLAVAVAAFSVRDL